VQNAKKIILFAVMFSAVAIGLCLAKTLRRTARQKSIKALQLLDKYSHALDSTSSFTEEYEKTLKGFSNSPMGRSASDAFYRGQCRYDLDSQRMYNQLYSWGKLGNREYDEDKPNYSLTISNEEIGYSNNEAIGIGPGRAWRFPRSKGFKPHLPMGACYLSGFMGSGTERLDNVLRNAKNISVRRQTQKVGDSECFVLEADTKCGQYIIWLDSEHGYHPAQIFHKASEGDYSFTHLLGEGDTAKAYLKNVRFEQIEGVWVPMEADSHSDLRNAQGHFSKDDYHYKRTKIILNPDHDKLGSFDDPLENPSNDPELKNGTRVRLNNLPIEYTWQDGKVVDANGRKVDLEKLNKKATKTKNAKPK